MMLTAVYLAYCTHNASYDHVTLCTIHALCLYTMMHCVNVGFGKMMLVFYNDEGFCVI